MNEIRVHCQRSGESIAGCELIQVRGNEEIVLGLTDSAGAIELQPNLSLETLKLRCNGFSERFVSKLSSCMHMLPESLTAFCAKTEYHPGEVVDVLCHAPEGYVAELLRYGKMIECVCEIGSKSQFLQRPVDEIDIVSNGLVDWRIAFQFTIPADARAGLFGLHLKSHRESICVPLVVSRRLQKSSADLLVLSSDSTWLAYNYWGGRNRYRRCITEGPDADKSSAQSRTGIVRMIGKLLPIGLKRKLASLLPEREEEWMKQPLSTKRPFEHCYLPVGNTREVFLSHLAEAEWRTLAWLEENEIEYDMATCHTLNEDHDLLRPYKAVLINGHSEYWSERMYTGLVSAHKRDGLSVICASGNTMYRPIEYLEDGGIRFIGGKFDVIADERELLGNRFTSNDLGTAAPYKVLNANHWAFDGVDVEEGGLIGSSCLNSGNTMSTVYDSRIVGGNRGLVGQGASGWETDKQPQGLKLGFNRIASGCNADGGADMLVKEKSGSQGSVFSAGSVTFSGSLLVDEKLSCMFKNIVDRALA